MNYEVVDVLYRSRITLLDHLEETGYDTAPYRKFSHKEIHEMLKAGLAGNLGIPPALTMDLKRREDAPASLVLQGCRVVYAIGRIKAKLTKVLDAYADPEDNPEAVDPATTELIVVMLEPMAPVFNETALLAYRKFTKESADGVKRGLRLRFFQAAAIVNNPLKHILVPPHEPVPKEAEADLMKSLYITSKSKLPFIRFHEDPIARMLGMLPGDIVKITRPSPTAGECVLYRVCVP